jgi:hypothetical protein
MTPPADTLGRVALNEKDVFGASKCSVEKPAQGAFMAEIVSRKAGNNPERLYALTLR